MIAPAHFVIAVPSRNSVNGYSVEMTPQSYEQLDTYVQAIMFAPRFRTVQGAVIGLPTSLSGVDLEVAQKLVIMMTSADQTIDPQTVSAISIILMHHYVHDRCFWLEAEPSGEDWNVTYHPLIAGADPILTLKQVPAISVINVETGNLDKIVNLGTVSKLTH